MEYPPSPELLHVKGQLAGSWHHRKAVQRTRDNTLIVDVNRWEVMTRTLGCALLGLPKTASNLKIVERRYARLSRDEFHQVVQDGVTYIVSLAIPKSKAERAQLNHRYMHAWGSSTFLRAIQIKKYLSGTELLAMPKYYTPDLEPDAFFQLNAREGLFREDETGKSDFYKILPRCWIYYRQRALLCREYGVESFIVIWNCKDPAWVPRIVQAIRTHLPPDAHRLFYVSNEADIDPFAPESVLGPIYLSAVDNRYHEFYL